MIAVLTALTCIICAVSKMNKSSKSSGIINSMHEYLLHALSHSTTLFLHEFKLHEDQFNSIRILNWLSINRAIDVYCIICVHLI